MSDQSTSSPGAPAAAGRADPARAAPRDPVTLVAGEAVLVTDRRGEIDPGTWGGLYHRDARVLSRCEVTVDGAEPTLLASQRVGASTLEVVESLAASAEGDPTALLLRRWDLDEGPRLRLEVRALERPVRAFLRVRVEADFALAQRVAGARRPQPARWCSDDGAVEAADGDVVARVEAAGGDAVAAGEAAGGDVVAAVEAAGTAAVLLFTVDAAPGRPSIAEVRLRARSPRDVGRPGTPPSAPTLRVVTSATRWATSVPAALADLRGLHVDVPGLDLRYLGAGAPWYMALFGRDTLLASYSSLIAGTQAAIATLTALARYQGRTTDERTGEQPGRILHELRTGSAEVFGVPSGEPYYGTVDATPLFVMLLAETHRWGAADGDVRALLPAARAAIEWCRAHGDLDGDGYLEYDADASGLVNQGWKDSTGAMVHADGRQAAPPIALAEAQAYFWGALRGLADLEERLGDPAAAPGLRAEAKRLRAAFGRDFWLPGDGLVAMALDGGKRPLAVASSNIGHCLWAGILDEDAADAAARRLSQPDLAAAWGLRTLGSGEAAYNPLGYHLGSVWPHDTVIGVAGLRRHGHREAARRLTEGLLAAAEAFGWRLPELFAGLDADEASRPVAYPTACSPQAWSAAAPLLLLREALGLDPDVPAGTVRVAPRLGDDVAMAITGIPLGEGHLGLRVRGSEVEVLDAPDGLAIVTG